MLLAGTPNDLNRLAQVSRSRYKPFYDAAGAGIAALFGHKKLGHSATGMNAVAQATKVIQTNVMPLTFSIEDRRMEVEQTQ